jgi:hypothetical protein
MALTWQQQVEIFECRYPRYATGAGSPSRNGYAAGFQVPDGRRIVVNSKSAVWIELFDPPPAGRFDRN